MSADKRKRAYARLSRLERTAIEEGLNKNVGFRQIARLTGRSPSTIAHEVRANRTIYKGGERGQVPTKIPEYACQKIQGLPGVCNGCKYRPYSCSFKLKLEYSASRADHVAHARKIASRMGVDRSSTEMAFALSLIRADIRKGLSPAMISCMRKEELAASSSTIYRWITRGYHGMADIELRRKVGYKPRKRHVDPTPTSHGKERSYEAFCRLDEESRASACEMDTVIGTKFDTKCILTLYLRPFKFQFALLIPEKTSSAVSAALDSLEKVCQPTVFSQLFGVMLTDNGSEFANTSLIERPDTRRIQLYYCDVRQSQQKAMCERNHVELRKLLPKGRGISFDDLDTCDMATLMSHMNSEPRPSLGWLSPLAMLKAAHKDSIEELLSSLGIEEIPFEKLSLTEDTLKQARNKDDHEGGGVVPAT